MTNYNCYICNNFQSEQNSIPIFLDYLYKLQELYKELIRIDIEIDDITTAKVYKFHLGILEAIRIHSEEPCFSRH